MRAIDSPIAYYRNKYLAEEVIRESVKKGLDAVILNPALILGPYDKNNWIQLFQRIKEDHLNGIPPTKKSFCFAEDVAKAHIQAFVHGRCGENYILSGPTVSLLSVCQWIARRLDKTVPTHCVPTWLIKSQATLATLWSHVTRKEPSMSLDKANIVCTSLEARSEKAHRELQYKNTKTTEEMLEATYQWWIHRPAGDLLTQDSQRSDRNAA
jgi:nucleoside-diphosphate-sugar epimerase